MNKPLRRVGLAMMVMMVLLLLNITYVQVIKGDSYRTNPLNQRVLLNEYSRQRGSIIDAAGNIIAGVKPTNDRLKFQRTYANGPLYAPATGYFSTQYDSSGIERAENDVLNGSDGRLFVRRLSDLITGRDPRGGDVKLTLNPKVQQAAYQAMTSRGFTGAMVAIKPQTGEILGMVSTPSFDPTPLASHAQGPQTKAWKKYTSDPANPMLNRAINDPQPPGSTFKLIDTSAALGSGKFTPNSRLPAAGEITIPGTTTKFDNYDGEHCGSGGSTVTMTTALALSCNTAFGTLTSEIGQQALLDQANKFGVGQPVKIPMKVTKSTIGDIPSKAALYSTGIGQQSVQFTPLQSAMITATIANGGMRMKPQLVESILAPDLSTIAGFQPQQLNQAISSNVASQIIAMMQQSEKDMHGSGEYAKYDIASKTGTAEHGQTPKTTVPYGWYTAMAPASDPKIAVSVMITDGSPYGLHTVGANVAGPIGHAVIQAYLSGGG
ncbi:MAG: peptidoglycan D,D-transpeptidase FtsI family protein [Sciscionella sp.]